MSKGKNGILQAVSRPFTLFMTSENKDEMGKIYR